MSGPHPEDPISLPLPPDSFLSAVENPIPPRRVAWTPDLGIAPVDREVRAICAEAASSFTALGAKVEAACPDLGDADAIFQVLRAGQRAGNTLELLETRRGELSPEVVFYAEKALRLTARELVEAEVRRGALYRRMVNFFETFDLLVSPSVMVPPFEAGFREVREVEGIALDDYFAWVRLTFAISATSCPAISVPCGFTSRGLPVGLQIIGPPRGEAKLLSGAALFESLHPFAGMLPIDPRVTPI
jgi:amidase